MIAELIFKVGVIIVALYGSLFKSQHPFHLFVSHKVGELLGYLGESDFGSGVRGNDLLSQQVFEKGSQTLHFPSDGSWRHAIACEGCKPCADI